MEKLIYTNPIIHQDFSDPDVIRVGNDFYMISSSFNYIPGVPLLHSKNLVEWEIINYIVDEIGYEKFNKVNHGEGIWAPSLRYHNETFYCVMPMPDEGIFVSTAKDPYGKWTKPQPILLGRGYEDPCPIWTDDGKCYMVIGFVKSRIGYNSLLGVFECSCDLTEKLSDITIVFDGHNNHPTIEGPKFHFRNGYYYIMAPAGSVKAGWQVCLRSKNIYGPYESKIVLMQNDTLVNGPHQGALIDLDDSDNNYFFIHFQDKRAYGRISHLQPVKWVDDWPMCGNTDGVLAGSPVSSYNYPINIKTNYQIPTSDYFKNSIEPIWQTPANRTKQIYETTKDGLKLLCLENDVNGHIDLNTHMLSTKIAYESCDISLSADLKNLCEEESFGFCIKGQIYTYLDFKKENGKINLYFIEGEFNNEEKVIKVVKDVSFDIVVDVNVRNRNIYDMLYEIKVNTKQITDKPQLAYAGRWVSTVFGIYANGNKGSALVKYFKQEKHGE